METCLVSFLYPGYKNYLKNLIFDIEKQTSQNFDLIFSCDKVKPKILLNKKITLIYFKNSNISEIRRKTIKKIISMGYKKIIFTDVDDRFDKRKMEVYNHLLSKYPVVFNEINIIKKRKKIISYFQKFLKANALINSRSILKNNFLGFTNSGINVDYVKKKIKFLSIIYKSAYDWFFYSNLLINFKAYFTSKTKTDYNCKNSSITNLPPSLDKKYVIGAIKTKKFLYTALSKKKEVYKKLLKNILYFEKKYSVDKVFFDRFNNRNIKLKGWWDI